MHRRSFLKYLLSTPLAAVIDYEKLLWVPGEKTIFIPSPKQVELLEMVLESPVGLYGIPYHQSDANTRRWLGFDRDIPLRYDKISLGDAIKAGHVHGYEIDSITNFMKRVNA